MSYETNKTQTLPYSEPPPTIRCVDFTLTFPQCWVSYFQKVINPFNPTGPTIVTVKKVFIYKALKTLLTDVLVTFCKYEKNKGSQLNMCSVT